MGHQVQYFANVERSAVRAWLDRLKGFYCHEPGDRTEEVARADGLPRGSVTKRIAEGLDRLRERLLCRGVVI